MTDKKRYQDYKEDPLIKFPALAWLLDRPKAMLPVLGVGIVGVGMVIGSGWSSYQNIMAPPENSSPYQTIEAAAYPGKTWAIELIEEQPPGVDAWEVSENYRGRALFTFKNYGTPAQQLPESLLMTARASGSGVETTVQVYGAGQAAQHFEQIVEDLEEATDYHFEVENVSQSQIARFADGFILNAGDAVIGVLAEPEQLSNLESWYIPQVEDTLSDSQCLSIHPRSKDYQRSFFYDREDYTGLLERENIATQVNFGHLPTPSSVKLLSIENPSAVAPEAPLPDSIDDIPEEREKPSVLSRPETRDAFEQYAEYQIIDENGPGCGWAWTARVQPVHNVSMLEQLQQDELEATQQAVNAEAREYITTQREWALQVAQNMPVINQWNRHVSKINAIHDQWEKLRQGRQEIQTDWYNYVQNHDAWSEFPVRQREARESYEEELQQCLAAQEELEEWEEEYGDAEADARAEYEQELEEWREAEQERLDREAAAEREAEAREDATDEEADEESPEPTPSPSPNPSPTFESPDTPERPDGCENEPERPSILDEDRGDEPMPPTIPEDVTIPNSWPKPKNVEPEVWENNTEDE